MGVEYHSLKVTELLSGIMGMTPVFSKKNSGIPIREPKEYRLDG